MISLSLSLCVVNGKSVSIRTTPGLLRSAQAAVIRNDRHFDLVFFRLLDDEIRNEMTRVIMRVKKPSRPKSEVFLDQDDRYPKG